MNANPKHICHVKGCENQSSSFDWFPAFGCGLGFCEQHASVKEEDRADWIIEVGRAKQEHDAGMAGLRSELGVS
jgi:hypothetical protein